MSSKVFLNGNYVDKSQAMVSIFDRGFLFADSVYEVIQVDGNRLFLFDEHMNRLKRSLLALNIDFPAFNFLQVSRELLNESPLAYGGVYIQVTRGNQNLRSHFWNNQKLKPFVVAFTITGRREAPKTLKAITYPDLRWGRCDIKSTSLLPNILSREEAALKNCDEALLVNSLGFISEGSSSNVFIYREGRVITPPLSENILPGITRQFCLETLNDMGISYEEKKISKEELFRADEVWLSSSTKDVLLVGQIDEIAFKVSPKNSTWAKLYENFQARKIDYLT